MSIKHHQTSRGHKIAYQHQPGSAPGVVFCCGYRSDMSSTKATALAEWCAEKNIAFTRYDYFAHGKTEGEFIDYTIGHAISDTLEILDHIATGPQIMVGSSMGGWVALHAALERKGQVRGLVGVAAAPDFTERLMRTRMSPEQRQTMADDGVLWVHSDYYNNDYPVTQHFLDEARTHLLLEDVIPLELPVHLIHGQEDADVPWETSLLLAEKLMGDEVLVTLIKDGDHRLNRPADLGVLMEALGRMVS